VEWLKWCRSREREREREDEREDEAVVIKEASLAR
jgi:hypothetical protein